MKNPWLEIPAEDYEGHMGNKNVDQLIPLRRIFSKALKDYSPERIAILGCATGNGIEEIDFETVQKVFAIDINPKYLKILRERNQQNLSKIETIECDLDHCEISLEKIDFIYASLIFEYVNIKKVLKNISKWIKEEGVLLCVLQLPCETVPEVTPSPFRSLEKLSPIMKLVDKNDFINEAHLNNLQLILERTHALKSGKQFWEGRLKKH